jgi:hypothetical protein
VEKSSKPSSFGDYSSILLDWKNKMLSLNRILVILLTIICFSLAFTSLSQAHEDPLQIPWPKGEKVPCRCDILAIDYELCLKGIGREECFKVKEAKQPVKPEKKHEWKWKGNLDTLIDHEEGIKPAPKREAPQMPPYTGQPLIYNEALPCHPVDIWLEKMQTEHQMYPFAQGSATVRSANDFEFVKPHMIMLVNPLLKKFMMLGVWENGYACVLASGSDFETLTNP